MSTSVPSVPKSPFSHLARNPAISAASAAPPDESTDDDEDEQDEADDESGDGKTKKKKSKKVKKAEDKEDDDDEKKPDARSARAREKDRIRAIVTSEAGLRFAAAALNVALESSMPRHAAIETLARMTAGLPSGANPNSLRDRMAGERTPEVGAGDARPAANLAEQIILADKKRRGEI